MDTHGIREEYYHDLDHKLRVEQSTALLANSWICRLIAYYSHTIEAEAVVVVCMSKYPMTDLFQARGR